MLTPRFSAPRAVVLRRRVAQPGGRDQARSHLRPRPQRRQQEAVREGTRPVAQGHKSSVTWAISMCTDRPARVVNRYETLSTEFCCGAALATESELWRQAGRVRTRAESECMQNSVGLRGDQSGPRGLRPAICNPHKVSPNRPPCRPLSVHARSRLASTRQLPRPLALLSSHLGGPHWTKPEMESISAEDLSEWREFQRLYALGKVGKGGPPPKPKVIADFLDSEDFRNGNIMPEPCTADTPYPRTPEEVSRPGSRDAQQSAEAAGAKLTGFALGGCSTCCSSSSVTSSRRACQPTRTSGATSWPTTSSPTSAARPSSTTSQSSSPTPLAAPSSSPAHSKTNSTSSATAPQTRTT